MLHWAAKRVGDCFQLSMPTTADSVPCLLKRLALPEQAEPGVIGAEEWAKRKVCRYGTVGDLRAVHHVLA